MIKFIYILFISTCINHSALATNLENVDFSNQHSAFYGVLKNFKSKNILRSKFKQNRHLKILKKPIVSEGKFNFISGKGIIWEIEKPFTSTIVISEKSIIEITIQNNTKNINKKTNTGGFYTVLESLLNGNVRQIENNFHAKFSGNSNRWEIRLSPKTTPLNKIFKEISLHGNQTINRIILADLNGDTTAIELFDVISKPKSTTSIEESYFAL